MVDKNAIAKIDITMALNQNWFLEFVAIISEVTLMQATIQYKTWVT
jgi:hypothetical protein